MSELICYCNAVRCPLRNSRSRCFQQDKYQFCENFKLYQLRSQSQGLNCRGEGVREKTTSLQDPDCQETESDSMNYQKLSFDSSPDTHISIPDEMAYRLMQMNLLHPSDSELETMDESILAKCRRDGL